MKKMPINTTQITDLFHDCGYIYLSTIEPAKGEDITVRLRTVKDNVTKAFVQISYEGVDWQEFEMLPEKADKTGCYTYFKGIIPGQEKMFKYRFRAENDNPENGVYYARTYVGKHPMEFDERKKSIKTDNFWTLVPGFHTPDWAKGVIWYSVMPDAYYNGDITNDEPVSGENYSNPWDISQHSLQHKYGGDLRGIEKKLEHIRGVGGEAIFTDPIFKSSQNAGYGTEFYKQIENSFGNKEILVRLIDKLHKHGMHYMIDVVLAFVAVRHIWFNEGNTNPFPAAVQEWANKYHDLFFFNGKEGDTTAYKGAWGGALLNHASEQLKNDIYRDKDSYLQYYCSDPFNIDAIRYDCGGDLFGIKENGERIGEVEILGDMRRYLRKINPEILLLSEASMYYAINTGVWDSRWNLEFVKFFYPYMRGEKTESFMLERLDNESCNLPRNFALCQYNSLDDHDRPRCRNVEPYAFKAAQIMHMTEIGSPCIYYGDEIKLERADGVSFYAMNWNEADWNYEVLHNTKALTELRKKYTALRRGIIKYISIDDDNHIFAYARKDENGLVITAASRNGREKEFSVNVRDLCETDGTIFTDWFTGRKYPAQNGYIDVILPAGGTVLVRGEDSSSYKGGFSIDNIGEGCNDVTVPCDNAFSIDGEGFIGTEDSLTFVNNDIFNTCSVSAKCKTGSGMILIRADKSKNSAFVGVKINGNNASVMVRKFGGADAKCVAKCEIIDGAYIIVSRDSKNNFGVYTAKTLGAIWNKTLNGVVMRIPNDIKVIAENIYADIPNHAYAGIAAINNAAFYDLRVKYDKQSILFDEFKKGNSAMFDIFGAVCSYGKNGVTVTPESDAAELLTNAYDADWSFKSAFKLNGVTDGNRAGIICRQDEDISVFAGRMILNGRQKFVFGRETAGRLAIYYTTDDTSPKSKATVQLQRVGTAFTALYSYNGTKWHEIGSDIIANMCAQRVGITAVGSSAVFDYACFGNSVYDGISYNTPHMPGKIKTDFRGMVEVQKQPEYEIISGDWAYDNEGYIQRSAAVSQMGIRNKLFGGFKADAVYIIDSGKGRVGFEFAKPAFNTPLGDGVEFSLDNNGTVSICRGGEILAEALLDEKFGKEVKISVEYRNGVLAVLAGNDGEPIIILNDFYCNSGYITYFTEGVQVHINNYLTASYDAECQLFGYNRYLKNGGVENLWGFAPVFFSPFGAGSTDFVAEVRLKVKGFEQFKSDAAAGIGFCVSEGRAGKEGYAVMLTRSGTVEFKVDGVKIAETQSGTDKKHTDIMVVKKNDIIRVYLNGSKEYAFEYTDLNKNGGTIACHSNGIFAEFSKFTVEDITNLTGPEKTRIYRSWMK